MENNDSEILKALLKTQIRNQAILETILKTQTRILSKVKKEKYDYTKEGLLQAVEDTEKSLIELYGHL